jgi:hypothetical protein
VKHFLIILLVLLFVSGCEDQVAEILDVDFQNFKLGTQKLEDTKTSFPKYSREYYWHLKTSDDDSSMESKAQVTLIYHTRHGNYFLRFEDNLLVHKRKIP